MNLPLPFRVILWCFLLDLRVFVQGQAEEGVHSCRKEAKDNEVLMECTTAKGKAGLCMPWTKCNHVQKTYREVAYRVCKYQYPDMTICCPRLTFAADEVLPPPPEPEPELGVRGLGGEGGDAYDIDIQESEEDVHSVQRTLRPWMASVGKVEDADDRRLVFLCSGALVRPKYVLTSAQCILDEPTFVRVGLKNLSGKGPPHRDYDIQGIVTHGKFAPPNLQYDIALVRLHRKVKMLDDIKPVKLPSGKLADDIVGMAGVLTGMGYNAYDWSHRLIEVSQKAISQEECSSKVAQSEFFPDGVGEKSFCAIVPPGFRDKCEVNLGGPMAIEVNGEWTLIGIVTAEHSCDLPDAPRIYTRISSYAKWLKSQMKN